MSTEYDRLYTLVQEMNTKWQKLDQDIKSGQRRIARRGTKTELPIEDAVSGLRYGRLSVDGTGALSSMWLDPDIVVDARDNDILEAVAATINTATRRAIQTGLSEYEV